MIDSMTCGLCSPLQGVPEQHLNAMVDFLIKRLTLTEYAHRPAGTYSGGNKRKVTTRMPEVATDLLASC